MTKILKRQMVNEAAAVLAKRWAYAAERVCADAADDLQDNNAEVTVEAIADAAERKIVAMRAHLDREAAKHERWNKRSQKTSAANLRKAQADRA